MYNNKGVLDSVNLDKVYKFEVSFRMRVSLMQAEGGRGVARTHLSTVSHHCKALRTIHWRSSKGKNTRFLCRHAC